MKQSIEVRNATLAAERCDVCNGKAEGKRPGPDGVTRCPRCEIENLSVDPFKEMARAPRKEKKGC